MFAAIFAIYYVHVTTRNKERMALIEKGADASLFNTGKEGSKPGFGFARFTLKVGMLFMGIAVGILVGALLDALTIMEEEICYLSMIFFSAASLVVSNASL